MKNLVLFLQKFEYWGDSSVASSLRMTLVNTLNRLQIISVGNSDIEMNMTF